MLPLQRQPTLFGCAEEFKVNYTVDTQRDLF